MRRLGNLRGRLLAAGLVASGIVGGASGSVASAAVPSPAWQITQASFPTNLVPGSERAGGEGPVYELFVTNVGGKLSAGATVTDTLPAGLTASIEEAPQLKYLPRSVGSEFGACEANGQVVFCETTSTIAAGSSFLVQIPLVVAGEASSVVRNQVLVQGGGASASNSLDTSVTANDAPFGIENESNFLNAISDEAGGVPRAGAEPFVTTINIGVTRVGGLGIPSQAMRTVSTELPFGLVVNPNATTKRCRMTDLALAPVKTPTATCPPESQVGQAFVVEGAPPNHFASPIYNMVPPPGVPAELAFEVASAVVVVQGGLSGGFHLTAASSELLGRFEISEVALTLWGDPSDPRHDIQREGGEERGQEGSESCFGRAAKGCAVEPSGVRFLTMPTSCTEPLNFSATVDSWLGGRASATRQLSDREFAPARIEGCGELEFSPTIESKATTEVAESPSGLDFGIHQPQDEAPGGRATAALKDATVTLPEGMTLNPSAANGLGSCTEEQIGYLPEGGKVRFTTAPRSCPDSAKVGTLETLTPLLQDEVAGGVKIPHVLPGSVYVAKPFDNPFGSLLAIYLAVEDEGAGINVKLAGKVEPDPQTGRLTATFTENPELPIEDIRLHFFKGDRAALKTPLTCGAGTTTSTLAPWSTPEGADAHPSDSFQISSSCSASEAVAPKTASFTAGTTTPLAGSYSPFVLRIARPDGSQHISGIETTLPEGLVGKLAGIPYCPESGIALARSREAPEQGKLEQISPSCPQASEVGTVRVTAGAGNTPISVSGHAYLAGQYKGAPLSLVAIVPAIAGPFDLGSVVDRVALNVGEYDARIHAVADPLPTILDGIPLDVRSIELRLDRSGFTLNPTSCEVAAIEGSITTQAGQAAPLSNRFQVGECGSLAFKPKLKLSLKGATKRNGHPALKAVVTTPQKGSFANIAKAQVGLPHSEFLDQGNIGAVCTQPELKADACPKKAIYGHAKAWTPLLAEPLEGPVYLGVGFGHKLPDLVADLNGQIRILLHGKVDTDKQEGIRNTFETVPDAPVSRFVLELKGGRKGLIVNSTNICKGSHKAEVAFRAQNGKRLSFKAPIANSCEGKGKKKHGKRAS